MLENAREITALAAFRDHGGVLMMSRNAVDMTIRQNCGMGRRCVLELCAREKGEAVGSR